MRVAAAAEPDALEQLVRRVRRAAPRRRRRARAGCRRARARSARPRAPASSAGRRSRSSASGSGPRRQPPSEPTSTPATRTEPAEARSKPATIRSSVDLPEPLGPRTTQSSPCSTARLSPCSAATPPSGERIDAEDVLDLDERAHSSTSARAGAGAENARRVASRISAGGHERVDDDRGRDDERVDVEHERRLGRGGARRQADEIGDDGGEREPRERAGDEPRGGDRERAQAHDPPQQRRRGALRLEVEQLAAARRAGRRAPSAGSRRARGRARRSPPRPARAASRGRSDRAARPPRAPGATRSRAR